MPKNLHKHTQNLKKRTNLEQQKFKIRMTNWEKINNAWEYVNVLYFQKNKIMSARQRNWREREEGLIQSNMFIVLYYEPSVTGSVRKRKCQQTPNSFQPIWVFLSFFLFFFWLVVCFILFFYFLVGSMGKVMKFFSMYYGIELINKHADVKGKWKFHCDWSIIQM